MPIRKFPPLENATDEGIIALGGDLHPESLLLAYSQGIFPWPIEGLPLAWFCPEERAILDFSTLHLPRSLKYAWRKQRYRFTLDSAFSQVIAQCQTRPRPGQDGTWITPQVKDAYTEFHRLGHAHSCEVWDGSELVGGIYGVDAGGAFAGESMFHLRPNTSKFALLFLIDHLKSRGLGWLDIQVMTPHLEALGAKLISRDEFLKNLGETQKLGLTLFPQIPELI